MWTSRSIGSYVAAEAATLLCGRLYKPDATKRPLIYFTGGPGDDRDFITAAASGSQIAPRLADLGIPIVSAAFGGGNQFGNDTAQARIGQAWTWIKAQLNPKQDKFIGIGVSKGATALLNYARNNPANVAALLLIVPAVNLTDLHDNNRSGLAAAIEGAYGGSPASFAAAAPTHDPALNAAAHAALGIPVKMLHGDNDVTVVPQTVIDFASATGYQIRSMGATDHLSTAPAIDPIEDVWKFLGQYS
jgi:pimeloyl-ACP methyl ester carboxylesterase